MRVGVDRGWLAEASGGRICLGASEFMREDSRSGRKKGGRWEGNEREKKRKKERKEKGKGKGKERKEFLVLVRVFQNPILYFSQFFRIEFRVDIFLVVFTIFNNHYTKMGFQPNILN